MNLEIIAFVLSLACVIFNAKGHVLNWPLAILSSLAYGWVFQEAKLFGDAALQLVFVVLAMYGWMKWLKKSKTSTPTTHFSHIHRQSVIHMIIACAALFVMIRLALTQYTNSDVPNIDAFLTAASLVATYMSAHKWIENWLVWAFVDVIYIGLYIFKDLYLTALLYGLFVLLCVAGWRQWKKLMSVESRPL